MRNKLSILLLFLSLICKYANSLSVLSVDLGNEWMKVAIVSPGKPMEIVYNEESQRKTPLMVAFRDGERFFGDPALTTAVRFPDKVLSHLLNFIGKRVDAPSVQMFKKHFPFHNITAHETHSTVIFNHPDGLSFTPEELLAMILQKAKKFAEAATNDQKITDAVITVPPYFTQAERRAVMHSAKLAGLKVLQLINTNAAVALNYGVFRRSDFNESSPTNILFYDMGSTATVATVASYQLIKTKERGFVETNPQVSIKGVGFDRTLGGLEMQLRLREHLVKLFAEAKKKNIETIKSNKRAMAKLLKEAGRVKTVLSANTECLAQVENVMDDMDLRTPVRREEFEELCSDLLQERITAPIATALKAADLTLDDIQYIIPFGGNTRMPRIQQIMKEFLGGRDLSHSINTDEAAAMGAAYQAAYLSAGFKVKPFNLKDITLYPIQVEFSRNIEKDDGSIATKFVQRTLFARNNPYPQKKLLTFSKHNADFDFFISYGDISTVVRAEEVAYLKPLNISVVTTSGVREALSKHEKDKESKGIKAHFRMDESGILHLDNVDAVFEHKVEEQVPVTDSGNVVGDAIAKFGNTISKLFRSSDEKGDGTETAGEDGSQLNATAANDTNVNGTTTPDGLNASVDGSVNETTVNATKIKTEIKVKTIKEPIVVQLQQIDLPERSEDDLSAAKKKLEELNAKDRAKLRRDQALNKLESFISETKMKLYEEEYEKSSTDSEREQLLNTLNSVAEWLENEGDIETVAMENKLIELASMARPLFERVKEHRERPEAIKALKDMLNISKMFFESTKNVSQTEAQIFTEVEISTLERLIKESQNWLDTSEQEQAKTPLHETPKLHVKEVAEKISLLDREIKYLLNKARLAPPKKATEEPAKETEKEQEPKESQEPEATSEDSKKQEPNVDETFIGKDGDGSVPDPSASSEKEHTEL